MTDVLLLVAAIANFSIFAGYLFVAFFIAPYFAIQKVRTKVAGVLFFLTCGLTHLDLAFHATVREPYTLEDFTSWFHLPVHVIQACAVWMFTMGVYTEILGGNINWPLSVDDRSDPRDEE